ncbi:hypothetical protein AB0M95_39040 [Sphaerisporangium sp. NPDC051017]|uniref:hypothetical protein n=1 Tax=Sphaerisporangium sp. NPDC051017 TaxID=3154636 RepID=UPI003428FBCA
MIREWVDGLRRRQLVSRTQDLDGWTLADIYARYGRRVLAEAEHNAELEQHLAAAADDIARRLREIRYRPGGRHGYGYLLGRANGCMQAMFEPGAVPVVCGHSTAEVQLAAVCRVAIASRVLSS